MARTKSAKKAYRASQRKAVFNMRAKRAMRASVREYMDAVGGKGGSALSLLPKAFQTIDKAAKRGVIKKNTAARMKSRLAKRT